MQAANNIAGHMQSADHEFNTRALNGQFHKSYSSLCLPQKENVWKLLQRDCSRLQPICHPTNSIKALLVWV